MTPIIFHLDMNSYFASVEQQENPAWRGKPLGVCEHLGGIIIAASREAKKWGITTGTPVWEAKKIYPKIILTKTNASRYRYYADCMVDVVKQYTNHVEIYSIDEVFLDMTRVTNVGCGEYSEARVFSEAVAVALAIKADMKKKVGEWLTCSIGIAENKLLAKIASDMQKPDGLVLIHSNKFMTKLELYMPARAVYVNDLYQKLTLQDIPGIGRKQEKNLQALGIKTLLDLKNYPVSLLVASFGKIMGYHLHMMGQLKSSWKPVVSQDESIKSIGHMYTLPKEYRNSEFFEPVLYKLCEMVAGRLRKQGLLGNVIQFYVRTEDHSSYGEAKKIGYYTQDGREIFLEAMNIFDMCVNNSQKPLIKLIGITVSRLVPFSGQRSLFGFDEKLNRINKSLDMINKKYGNFTVCRFPVRLAGNVFRDSIGFGRIKEHIKKGID